MKTRVTRRVADKIVTDLFAVENYCNEIDNNIAN